MTRLTKTWLMLTLINVAATVLLFTGVIDGDKFPGLEVVFPMAAIFFGAFLISLALQKEVAKYNAEQQAQHEGPAPEHHFDPVESAHDHLIRV